MPKCQGINMNLTDKEQLVLVELRQEAEYEVEAGSKWMTVYLDNCPSIRNRKSFDGVLSSLSKKRYYRNEGGEDRGIWGQVFIGDRKEGTNDY